MPSITVAPVVVSPENDSKKASVTVMLGCSSNIRGMAPTLASTDQNRATIKKPSRARKSFFCWRFGYQSTIPPPTQIKNARVKGKPLPS